MVSTLNLCRGPIGCFVFSRSLVDLRGNFRRIEREKAEQPIQNVTGWRIITVLCISTRLLGRKPPASCP